MDPFAYGLVWKRREHKACLHRFVDVLSPVPGNGTRSQAGPVPLVEAAYTLRLKPWTRARKLYLPAALPSIYVGLQIAVLSAWIGTVGAEYAIGNGLGLGSYIASARDQFRMDIVLVGVFALAAGGVALSAAVRFATGKVSPWSQEAR